LNAISSTLAFAFQRGADLLAVNADGNMPYDICEDELTLDNIESEMAKRGITQEMIDQTRATNELQMLDDLKKMVASGHDLEYRDGQGATPVRL
jgi:protein phosphatase 1 regulatory subunit 16A